MTIRRILPNAAGICMTLIAGVGNGGEPFVFQQYQAVRGQVGTVANGLVTILNDETINSGYRLRAIRNLADMRATTAIRPLLNHLLFRAGEVTSPGPLMRYPAAEALVQYGSLIYPSVWAVTENKCSEEYLEVLACTLYCIDGWNVAVVRIDDKLVDPNLPDQQRFNLRTLKEILSIKDYKSPVDWPKRK